jgi:hypothetical protein
MAVCPRIRVLAYCDRLKRERRRRLSQTHINQFPALIWGEQLMPKLFIAPVDFGVLLSEWHFVLHQLSSDQDKASTMACKGGRAEERTMALWLFVYSHLEYLLTMRWYCEGTNVSRLDILK